MQVYIGDIPVWQGVQDGPGFTTAPFTFGINRGVIQQVVSESESEEIVSGYGGDNYNFITSPPGTSSWGTALGNWYFQLLSEQIGNLSGKNVLEIGAGTLYLADRIVGELGANHFYACDPAIRTASKNSNVEVVREYFSPDLFHGNQIDLAVSLNSLEHVPDPFQYLLDLRQILEPSNGTLFMTVPDSRRGLRAGDLGICIHEHLSYFVPESLANTLRFCGFAISWTYTHDDHIFVTARPAAALGNATDAPAQSEELLVRFSDRFPENLQSAQQLISSGAGRKSLAIHGCSAGVNTTLALLGINSDPNIFLFDGDSRKMGKYLPAFDQPILGSTDQRYKEMDTVVIAALAFYDEILRFIRQEHGISNARIKPINPIASD